MFRSLIPLLPTYSREIPEGEERVQEGQRHDLKGRISLPQIPVVELSPPSNFHINVY